VEALVDTGATYTLVQRPVLERLGISRLERQPFVLADGRRVEYDIAQVRVRINARERFTVCIFGDEGSAPLLGSVTLEEFGLGVDPVNKRLVPVAGFLV
jgi:clan AA aspartic protease